MILWGLHRLPQPAVRCRSKEQHAFRIARLQEQRRGPPTPFKRGRVCAATNLELLISSGYQYDHVLGSNRQCCLHNCLCFVFSVYSQELLDLYSTAIARVSPNLVYRCRWVVV